MRSIMLVDDEILAMEYLKQMVDWEAHGYRIAGCAANGRLALEIYEKEKPEVVISDIKMPGMDGLELARRLKRKNPDAAVILLSAYRDFEYARKGFQYGVSNYLLKHELCKETLLEELDRVCRQLELKNRKEKIYQKYFMNQLIYNQADTGGAEASRLGNRLFLLMLHKSNRFQKGEFVEEEWSHAGKEALEEILEVGVEDKVFYIADVQITSSNIMVLYQLRHTASKHTVQCLIEQKCNQISTYLLGRGERRFHILYSDELRPDEISSCFRKMSGQIRYAVFWETGRSYPAAEIPGEDESINWGEKIMGLRDLLYEEGQCPEQAVSCLFRMGTCPRPQLQACRSLIHLLDNLIRELEDREGICRGVTEEGLYTMGEAGAYYEECIGRLYRQIQEKASRRYSRQVLEMLRYMRKHYGQELSLDLMGEILHMNGVYLGQIFKKEVGTTFLKYLTNLRIEEAKRLLREENCTVSRAASLVGYRTSQYFSQIFTRTVGMNPQEYRRWNEKD